MEYVVWFTTWSNAGNDIWIALTISIICPEIVTPRLVVRLSVQIKRIEI